MILMVKSHRVMLRRHPPGEWRDTGLGTRGGQEPFAEPQHVQARGRQEMSQMDPGKPHVAGPSPACAPNPARNRPFDAATAGILLLKCVGPFPLPGGLEGLILRLGTDGQCPPWIALLRTYTLGYVVAAPTVLRRELHRDDGIPPIISGRRPARAHLASRTSRVLLVPIDLEVLGVKTGCLAGLP